ncbi:hypothetical protein [Bacillus sp. RAR_GA_16]|uniref:hypothetical protein n=1 Tax=Bacillus sp. RAR_GA_16 TaxID=2876774 RepID=UPI001CC9F23A|nr:hypothetical protein [Bacillus sp. RAR_GA_16]MCA0173124.1 hypothetical protein [Bacillus sp. RAR_GA_16]
MRKKLFLVITIGLSLLVGCSEPETFEDYFHKKMEENKAQTDDANDSYSLIHHEQDVVHPNDAIAIFMESQFQEERIFIAYFEKENDQWEWRQTRGAAWDDPVHWSSMNSEPYIYSGTIQDDAVKEVYAGREKAKIINVSEGKRFWYAVSDKKEVDVKMVMEDGTEEVVEELG